MHQALRRRPGLRDRQAREPLRVALGADLADAYARAFETDPTSAFGGIIAFNRTLEATTAHAILDRQFVEVVVAPEVDPDALAVFAAKPNVRVLASGAWPGTAPIASHYARIAGGLLVQDADRDALGVADVRVVTRRQPTEAELADLLFAWRVAMHVKSNAIVYAKEARTIGIGAGQMSRVVSARIAGMKAAEAGLAVHGAAMASTPSSRSATASMRPPRPASPA